MFEKILAKKIPQVSVLPTHSMEKHEIHSHQNKIFREINCGNFLDNTFMIIISKGCDSRYQ